MENNIVVRKSKIHNNGIFANKDFKKGDVVLKWNPKQLKKSEVAKLPAREKHYLYKTKNGRYFLMQPIEKYVNHSCEANTKVRNNCDIALRDIKKGEEITSDYSKEGSSVKFICRCGSKNCKGVITIK